MIEWIIDWLPWWVPYVVAIVALIATMPLWLPPAKLVWAMLPTPIRIALGAVVAGLAAYLAGRNKGASNERERQQERDAQATARRVESDAAVDKLTPNQRKKEMEEWYRD